MKRFGKLYIRIYGKDFKYNETPYSLPEAIFSNAGGG